MCGDMGLFKLEFLAQNLFISSLAVVPIGAALKQRTDDLNRGLPLLISHLSCADAGWCAGHFGPSSFITLTFAEFVLEYSGYEMEQSTVLTVSQFIPAKMIIIPA